MVAENGNVLIFLIYKELLIINKKKMNIVIKKWVKDINIENLYENIYEEIELVFL